VQPIINRPLTPGQSRPFDVRPEIRVFTPPPDDPPPPDELHTLAFEAIPHGFHDDIADRRMQASASMVIGAMLWLAFIRKVQGFGDGKSCWATNKAIAGITGLCERQVRNIRRKIIEAGWLRRDNQVGPSDPMDPRNRTGERWYFTWLTGEMVARDPFLPHPSKPKRGRPPGGGRKFISPPLDGPSEAPFEAPTPEMHFREIGKCISPNEDVNSKRDKNTLDVVAGAGPEEEETPPMEADPVAVADNPPAAEPSPPPVPVKDRAIEAHYLVSSLMGRDREYRFRDLRPRVFADGSIEWTVPPGMGPAPDAAELAEIERLKPEVLKVLASRGVKVPRPPSATAPENDGYRPRAAAKVPPGVRATVGGLISGLRREGATNSEVLAATKALVSALGPHTDHDRTVALFQCWCGKVRAGKIAEATLLDAFEAACGKSVEKRGALFVALVKRALKGEPAPG
jgi:hypothetical protein